MSWKLPVPITIVPVNLEGHRTKVLSLFSHINTSAVLHLNEGILINSEEVSILDHCT